MEIYKLIMLVDFIKELVNSGTGHDQDQLRDKVLEHADIQHGTSEVLEFASWFRGSMEEHNYENTLLG